MRRRAVPALVAAALAAAPAGAGAAPPRPVSIEFQSFAPSQVDLLPGESVEWTNVSNRVHTVTADDRSFDSGQLSGGARFVRGFDAVGAYLYHCTIHPGMTGAVDVRRVILDPLPAGPVPAGGHVEIVGRTADAGAAVTVERDTGGGFHALATATAAADGTWSVAVTASATADFRARLGADISPTRRLFVSDRRVRVRATRAGVEVSVTPADPGARVRLELHLRERFGWWPTAVRRLDYLSRADFRVRRPAWVRAVLVDRDGWTPLATSRVLRLRTAGGNVSPRPRKPS